MEWSVRKKEKRSQHPQIQRSQEDGHQGNKVGEALIEMSGSMESIATWARAIFKGGWRAGSVLNDQRVAESKTKVRKLNLPFCKFFFGKGMQKWGSGP